MRTWFNIIKWQHNKFIPFELACYACYLTKENYDRGDRYRSSYSDWPHWFPYSTLTRKEKKEMVAKAAATPVGKVGDWYWHVHHQVLVEQLTQPLNARILDIQTSKDAKETRLHFMRPVQNPLVSAGDPEEIKRAQVVYDAVKKAYYNGDVTKAVLDRASTRIDTAKSKVSTPTQAQWEALHKKECFHYCPWNGKTLLPTGKIGKL